MTISRWTAAGGVAGALLLGLLLGRYATPAKVVETEKLVSYDRGTELTWHAYVGRTESKIEEKTNWKTVTEWKPGNVVTQTVYVDRDRTEATRTDTATTDGKLKERIVEKIVEKTKLVESKPLDWLVGAGAGTAFKDAKPIYTVEVGRRIVGPFFLKGQVQGAGLSTDGAAAFVSVVWLF
jgi:hypothetical protein